MRRWGTAFQAGAGEGRGERYVLSEGFAPGYIKVKPSRLNQRVTFSLLPERQYHEPLGYCLPPSLLGQ